MARVTVEDCLKRVNNRFLLVHLGAKRVIQLRKGAKPLVDAPKNKEVVLALREIAAGAVDFDSIVQIEQEQLSPKTTQHSLEAFDNGSTTEESMEEEASEPEVQANTEEEVEREDAANLDLD